MQGTITIPHHWRDEVVVAGFVGRGADGKEYSNLAGTRISSSTLNCEATCTTKAPQLTTIFLRATGPSGFKHTRMAAGDYLLYVRLGKSGPIAAWKQITISAGERLNTELHVDPAAMGTLVVTLPDAGTDESEERFLSLVPQCCDCSPLCCRVHFEAARVKKGEKRVTVKSIPAGEYRLLYGSIATAVQVTAGNETFKTLVEDP